jgi:hypothetical protein
MIQIEYKIIEKNAGPYVFYWLIVASGIYKTGSFADRECRKKMDEYGDQLQNSLKSKQLKLSDIPSGVSTKIDFLKLSPTEKIPEVNKLRDKFINK